mgnify:CR=1 FL=1
MSFPDLTPTSTQSAIVLTSTGSSTQVSSSLAINFYGHNSAFQAGAAAQVAYTFRRLGGLYYSIERAESFQLLGLLAAAIRLLGRRYRL